MSETCPSCGNESTDHADSHKSWVGAMNYKEIHFYDCGECGERFTVER